MIVSTLTSTTGQYNGQDTFEQQPPIPEAFYVQQLSTPLNNGDNMIVRVKYYVDSALTNKIDIYDSNSVVKTLRDDGVFPDSVAGDYNYAMYIKEDIGRFKAEIASLESKLTTDGGVIHFDGHSGQFIQNNDIPRFDVNGFDHFAQVQVYQPILDVTQCENTILKQNSLFITDLAVVEDPARTYNVSNNTGNPTGAWTFGTLMKEMANTPATGISAKDFLREWVKTWTVDQTIGTFAINQGYINVEKRERVFMHLIGPWLNKANGTNTTIDANNWEGIWNNTPEANLLINAPFKLMAIVNRLDLRGNSLYGGTVKNAGETRFIFTLIDPTTGKPPVHDDIGVVFIPTDGAIDWIGMNVILEYGNPIKNKCDLKLFAQQWYDLSAFTLGSASFNDNLQQITDQIVKSGKGGTKNLNRSALNQLRTNEKILQLTPPGANIALADWEGVDWQLRQFELDETGYLTPTVVTNTLVDDRPSQSSYTYNSAANIPLGQTAANDDIEDWIYGPNSTQINRIRISKGNHNIPEQFLAGSATIYKEMSHYFGLDWTQLGIDKTLIQEVHNPNLLAKQIRHQISLNTCQGCHGGENKTNFTQMIPRGYGEPANYWDAIPSYVTSSPVVPSNGFGDKTSIDDRFFSDLNNIGKTRELTTNSDVANLDFIDQTSNLKNQIVSPFLTGRRYSSRPYPDTWQDDELNNGIPANGGEGAIGSNSLVSDEKLTGLYYVNDPSNEATSIPWNPFIQPPLDPGQGGNYPQLHTQRWGFNDLKRRQTDLCDFIKLPCSGLVGSGNTSTTLPMLKLISFIPFPLGAH